jgi:hypothetical protein
VGLSPLGTAATSGLFYKPHVMMIVEQLVEWRLAGETEVLEKTCSSATLSTIYPTWLDPGSNQGRRGGKPAINRLSYDAAPSVHLPKIYVVTIPHTTQPPH